MRAAQGVWPEIPSLDPLLSGIVKNRKKACRGRTSFEVYIVQPLARWRSVERMSGTTPRPELSR